MAPEFLRTLGLWTGALALVAGGVHLLRSRLGAQRRRQREAAWRELCLRMELVPDPAHSRAATGQFQGMDFSLHDTGSAWLVELPLSQPLLPPGILLLPAGERRLRPGFKLRQLRWSPTAPPHGPLVWYSNLHLPPSKVEAPRAFLEEVERAAQAHAPLRVEPRRLVHALSTDSPPSMNVIRDTVRALEATAQRWLETAARQGLPRVRPLPPLPSAFSLLRGVLARRPMWQWGLANNAALPLTLGALMMGRPWIFFVLLVGALYLLRKAASQEHYAFKGLVLGTLALASTFGAPWYWAYDVGLETSPPVLSVRESVELPHRKAELLRFRDAVIRPDLTLRGTGLYPIVPRDWRPGEPVTVWAVRLPPKGQERHPLGGIASHSKRSPRMNAVALALEHKLQVHPHAVYVDFSQSPDERRERYRIWALLLWGLPNALWLCMVVEMWESAFRRSRRVL